MKARELREYSHEELLFRLKETKEKMFKLRL